jgi:general secretion pathway protein C
MLIPRSITPFALATLALSAWLHARGISALVGGVLAAPGVSRHLPEAVAHSDPVGPRSAAAILARNPFDSDTGPLDPALATVPALPGLSACNNVHVLAIAAGDQPSASLALLRLEGEVEPQLRGVGSDVVAIEPSWVVLDQGGTTCVARMFQPVAAARAAASSPPHKGPLPKFDGVAAVGPTAFAVDRSARDAILETAGDWMKTISVRPEKAGDVVVGMRVTGVAAGSPVEGLGIHAGDVIESVNRIPLTTPEKMLEALGALHTADHLAVVVLRSGKEVQVDYDVR